MGTNKTVMVFDCNNHLVGFTGVLFWRNDEVKMFNLLVVVILLLLILNLRVCSEMNTTANMQQRHFGAKNLDYDSIFVAKITTHLRLERE